MIVLYTVEKYHPEYGWTKVTGDHPTRERAERERAEKISANHLPADVYRVTARVV